MDGDPSEYGAGEVFPIDGGTAWITWDADNVYVAVQHPDITTGGGSHWVLVYLGDGTVGASSGVLHGTQEPALTIPQHTLIRWKCDDSFDSWVAWNGSVWSDTPNWLGTQGSAVAEDNGAGVVEFRIPDASVGLTDTLSVHVSLLYEGVGYESSYGPTPPGSFVSGTYDPDHTQAWVFDRTAPDAPSSYAPLP